MFRLGCAIVFLLGSHPCLVAADPGAHQPAREAPLVQPDADELLSAIQDTIVNLGIAPAVLTSETPPATVNVPASGQADLDWVRTLARPDLPARWDDRVVEYLRHFQKDPRGRANMRAWMKRSQRYRPMMRRVLREHGLPQDLMYVAMVESAFVPRARSHAGAVGIWQFIAVTGREYGLARSRWLDERLDPERATEAAARYLGDLHRRLGSWELALAAYNMGYSALLRSVQKYNANDFWLLSRLEAGLPVETVEYVAKIVACAVVGANPRAFGFGELKPEPPPKLARVRVAGGRKLSTLARAAGMPVAALNELNPALVRNRVPPELRSYPLRIPADRLERFQKARASLGPSTPSHAAYVVRFGESLADIAYRFQTSRRALRQLNELRSDDEIGPGYTLLVPDVRPRKPRRSDRPVATLPERTFAYPRRERVFYQTQTGDSCDEIAAFFGVTVSELRRWNAVDPTAALLPGMVLQLYVPKGVKLSQAVVYRPDEVVQMIRGSEAFFDFHEAQRGRVRMRYQVRDGEQMHDVAERFDLSIGSLARINRIGRYTKLRPKQELIVYVSKELAVDLAQAKLAKRQSTGPESGARD